MKEYVWCTPEIIREPHQRGNLQFTVHVAVQHTADHKRDDDSRKCMMNVLGDKVSKKCPVCFSTIRKLFFLSLPPSTIQAGYYHFLSFLPWCDIVFTIFTEIFVSNSSQATEEYWTRNEFPSQAFFINCWLFNNYSPKWRWKVVNIYRAVKQRGK